MGGLGRAGYPALLGRLLDWRVVAYARGGTGYVEEGSTGQPFRTQVPDVVRAKPDIVLVAGSRNDAGYPINAQEAAVRDLFGTLHAHLPTVQLVAIGPIWTDSEPPPQVEATNEVVRREAMSSDVIFIDALSQDWLNPGLIGVDGIHPTDRGHRVLAERVKAALVSSGVTASLRPGAKRSAPTSVPSRIGR
jgi:lysophospholipase L1-like esterase